MNSIFEVSISAGVDDMITEVATSLPAEPYALLDIWDRLHVPHGKVVQVWFVTIKDFPALRSLLNSVYSPEAYDLCELNVLAQKLSGLDDMQRLAFNGLLRLEGNRGKDLSVADLIDLASSTECCMALPSVVTDEELGEYVVENDLAPELESIPDHVYDLLHYKRFFNYEKIGEQQRLNDGGVFVPRKAGDSGGYVIQQSPLIEAHRVMDFSCPQPDYTILLRLKNGTELKLPSQGPLPETEFTCIDCKVPGLTDAVNQATSIRAVQQLAAALDNIEERKVPALKAIVKAAGGLSVNRAIWAAENIGHFVLAPQILSPDDLAREELYVTVDTEVADMFNECMNLYQFGEKLLEQRNDRLTEYGLIGRDDCEPLLTPEFDPTINPEINPGLEVMR